MWDYAVAAGDALTDNWKLSDFENGIYHLQVYGPNGFFREFTGSKDEPSVFIRPTYEPASDNPAQLSGKLVLTFANGAKTPQTVIITDNAYKTASQTVIVQPGRENLAIINTIKSHSWYDFTFTVKGHATYSKRYAGRIETGRNSKTDPLMGRVV
ncbi:phospholipase domain-containing protein [Paraflavitalea speifideaquila]|uniref:phospholipase domain-containing protein n=1 Tax=Paraflavitalea speifideaquila TaxID=3076558 RepID=UPI0028EE6716|nr:phospholipase domain-containing protein [Paraflavitalea speifideiaquila]